MKLYFLMDFLYNKINIEKNEKEIVVEECSTRIKTLLLILSTLS